MFTSWWTKMLLKVVIPSLRWLLVIVSMGYQQTVQACNSGWFGLTCEFKCHCKGSVCDSEGQCSKCTDGYFGPSCQYVDLAFNWATGNTSSFVYDQRKDTCNTIDYADEVGVQLQKPFRFSWIRIEVNSLVRGLDFKVTLSPGGLCRHQRNFYIGNSTVDVTCDETPLFTSVTVRGPIAGTVCSIYISGGRNLALKQNATQSSTTGNNTANRAIDGTTDTDLRHKSCSSTYDRQQAEWWSVRFDQPVYLFRVAFVSSKDNLNHKKGLDVFTYSEGDTTTNTYINVTHQDNMYDVNLEANVGSIVLTIEDHTDMFLTLCEVEAFGETLCPDGTYGLDCSLNCSCTSEQTCSLITGMCSEGCVGYYGFECDNPCNPQCNNLTCWQRSGKCYQCKAGYIGTECNTVCPAGSFGTDCSYPCPESCQNKVCRNADGFCIKCKVGLVGPYCEAVDIYDISYWLYAAIVIGLVLLPVCCIVCKSRNMIERGLGKLQPEEN